MLFRRMQCGLLAILGLTSTASIGTTAAPNGFPASGNGLWFSSPGTYWAKEWLPIGNGYLAAMLAGGVETEVTQLNIESLWSGGAFQDPTYNGGNHYPNETASLAQWMQTYRQEIMGNASGTIADVNNLMSPIGAYGSYAASGFFLSTLSLPSSSSSNYSDYARWLDMDQALHETTFSVGDTMFQRESFCSHPAQACVQSVSALNGGTATTLPEVTWAWANLTEAGLPMPNITCLDESTLMIRGLVSEPGMLYELLASVQAEGDGANVSCNSVPVVFGDTDTGSNATLSVMNATTAWLTWVGGTNYDMDAGDAAHNFSFAGSDPHSSLLSLLSTVTTNSSLSSLRSAHISDYQATILNSGFSLDLGGPSQDELNTPTDQIRAAYQVDTGNAYLEWLTFNLGRYMLVGSARGSLPANLQGKWANGYTNPWSADHHANINLQMNYWVAEMTGLDVTQSLWDYMEKTWAPRGTYTAQVLYNISRGWATHDEMNIFGHTGMKEGNAQWANYPESNAWMMLHVWDHFDYTNDVDWFQSQGWPLLKGVASFHLDKLIPDTHFNDGTLVVAPCNSPEQLPITLGCAHAQQLIWMLFNAIEKGFEASGDTDTDFLTEVQAARTKMDKGIHVGSWGQLQEWKPDMDSPTDTHRHLSHLIGLYPGYAVASYANQTNYTTSEVIDAATVSLIHRGNGTGPDADAGWEKAWRAACWAQLQNTSTFYHELTYTLYENLGPNLFSLYDPGDTDPIFQIDANFGFPAALLNGLLQAPDTPSYNSTLVVTLLPTLPATWPTGSLTGAKVRGGMTVDVAWSNGKATAANVTTQAGFPQRPVQIVYGGEIVAELTTGGDGTSKTITF